MEFFIILIFLVIVLLFLFDNDGEDTKHLEKCDCGQEKRWCKSYTYTTIKGGFGRKNTFACRKFREKFEELYKQPFMQRISKEIKENGKSCPENWK